MDMPISDVIIHLDETLPSNALSALENELAENESVVSAHIAKNNDHLLIVAYNPRGISSRELLEQVTRHEVHAELIGL